MPESERMLRRLERNATLVCLVLACAALVIGGDARAAMSVLGGGVLAGASYWAIKSSVVRLADGLPRGREEARAQSRPGVTVALVLMAGRYALLGLLAYVMIARLRMHPVGLIVGASSVVAAAAIETIRTTRT